MKQKRKKRKMLKRALLCSWSVLMLVATFFIIKWAMHLSEIEGYAGAGSVDTIAHAKQPEKTATPTPSRGDKEPVGTPTPVPQAEFTTEYAHLGGMKEDYGHTEGVAYGLRYPLCEDGAVAAEVSRAAQDLLAGKTAELLKEDGTQRTLLIDYEDGETAGLFSVLFYIEKEIDGVKSTETEMWLYNKKEGEPADAQSLFAAPAYRYVAKQVNAVSKPAEETETADGQQPETENTQPEAARYTGTREEFPVYLLTADGAKFYYENNGERQEIVIPYIELHTYMAVTENGTVVAERIRKLDPEKPMIAFTFDDGPHYEQTPRLLEILEANDARATFFVLGDRVLWGESNKKALKMVYDSGNEVASHTYSHKHLKELSAEEIKEEVKKTRDAVFSVTGEYPTLLRPPYGEYSDAVKAYSYAPLITWNLDSKDWYFRNTEQIVEHVLAEAGDGKIVLMHDIHWFTVDAAEILIPELRARGYQIVTVQELFYYKDVEQENGKVYHSSYN